MKPRIKICGLRRVEDAQLAVDLGATHIGCVRAPSSPRSGPLQEVAAIFDAVRDRATTVLVARGLTVETMVREARDTGAHALQLFDFSQKDVEALSSEGLSVYRVYCLDESTAELPVIEPTPTEDGPVMLDVGGGGSGRSFDWSILGHDAPRATFIAGGIRPDNVRRLLERRPFGIDLSSGVESAPGIKDPSKLRSLFREVNEWKRP
jgi:phosphoribosylanthranilate isomerase